MSFKSLSSNEIVSYYDRSNIVLDISHPGQSGLTMRTFETIGAGKKLITTNADIKNYPFYNPENIFNIWSALTPEPEFNKSDTPGTLSIFSLSSLTLFIFTISSL